MNYVKLSRLLNIIAMSLSVWGFCGHPAFAGGSGPQAQSRHTGVVAKVLVKSASRQTLRSTTIGYGKVQAQPDAVQSVGAPHAGTVGKVLVRLGQTVEKGSVVAELDVAAATQEAYRKAMSAADLANTKLQRQQKLRKDGVISQQALDIARKAASDARAALKSLQNIGAQNPVQRLRTPISGTVTSVAVSQGDRIKQDSKIATIAPSKALAVLLGIEAEDIGKIKNGLSVDLSPATAPSEHFTGTVASVNTILDPQTQLINVLVNLKVDGGAAPAIGTEMRGSIVIGKDAGIAVPREAVLYDKKGAYVFVIRKGHAHRVGVTTGADSHSTMIVDGKLQSGEGVVVQGNYELTDGMKVDQVDHAVD